MILWGPIIRGRRRGAAPGCEARTGINQYMHGCAPRGGGGGSAAAGSTRAVIIGTTTTTNGRETSNNVPIRARHLQRVGEERGGGSVCACARGHRSEKRGE